ncbi:MAG: FG-GAP repeat protein [Acidimicrobiales bacterium]
MAELLGSGTISNDSFGSSVSISGDTAVVAAPDHAQQAGAVYVFGRTSHGWTQTAVLTAADSVAYDMFGTSVVISGNTIVVGAEYSAADAGRAYVFTRTAQVWHQTAELKGSDTVTYDQFGSSVAIAGTTIAVGADLRSARAGRVYVFTKRGVHWIQTAELKASDSSLYDEFGSSLAMDGHTMIVGAEYHGAEAGSAYVLGEAGGRWRQTAELKGSDTSTDDYFGSAVAVSGGTVVVGAYDHAAGAGRAYVFEKTPAGFEQTAELQGSGITAGDYFGSAVAVSGHTVVVGAEFATGNAGGIYVFTDTSAGWAETATLMGSDTATNDEFGDSVAISGDTVLVGALGHSSKAGSAYVFAG